MDLLWFERWEWKAQLLCGGGPNLLHDVVPVSRMLRRWVCLPSGDCPVTAGCCRDECDLSQEPSCSVTTVVFGGGGECCLLEELSLQMSQSVKDGSDLFLS